MKFNKRKQRKKPGVDYNNRINVVIAVIFLLAGAVVYRLYHVQIKNHDYYIAMASSQHQAFNELKPERGKIYIKDREGENDGLYPIATNKNFAHIFAVPKEIKDPEQTAEKIYDYFFKKEVEEEVREEEQEALREELKNKLKEHSGLGEEELLAKKQEIIEKQNNYLGGEEEAELAELRRKEKIEEKKKKIIDDLVKRFSKPDDPYEPIKEKVPEERLEGLEELNLTGIKHLIHKHRFYPENFTSDLTGFTGFSEDQKKGMYGLEGFFDEELSGEEGTIRAERDANGNLIIVNDMEYNEEKNGTDLVLTIDRTVQYTACEKLHKAAVRHGADSGSVIVMRPESGEIVAMCSYPDYDPNNYSEVEDSDLFNNQAIIGQYEPGSVFKAITLAAGLDMGVIKPETLYNDKGSVMVEGWPKPIKNSDFETHGGYGWVDMNTVLADSLNTGTIFAAQKIGAENFRKYIKDFGFGEKNGIELETESPGDISNLLRKKIRPIDLAVSSFGQGITVTPLQMVNSYAAIANGGKLMKPYLVTEMRSPDGQINKTQPREIKRVISEKVAMLISGMLVNVVDGGHASRAAVDGYYVAGKTGTAQVASEDEKGYGERTIHTFVGFSPVEDPEFVMLVRLDDPKDVYYSSSSAAPLFGDIADFILNYWKIPKERLR